MLFPKEFLVLFVSRFRRMGVVLAIILLDVSINLALLAYRPGLFLKNTPEPVDLAPAPVSARSPSSTPYQPLHPTLAVLTPAPMPATSTPVPPPSTDFYGIDFGARAARIKMLLQPHTDKVNHGKPIVIAVNPGDSCHYQDHRACIRAYRTDAGGNVIFISVHSGIGGEAETYRRAVEGIGLNRAAFSIKLIRSNLARLEGAPVKLIQGDRVLDGLALAAAARVPPALIRDYFHGPVEQAMALAATVNPSLEGYLNPDSPVLVFETCGWKLPGEPWAPGVSSTTGSVYVGVIQMAP